ncbi:hypothetical protein J2754_000779 [Halarchaeum solikamskense]|uniref:hypothetical protein n=1 Tax=Halarchaeum nitratireducens TaxID=489913 RepID=UPI001B3AF707|nr:hypothetical protein [Halarchaeum solikamskense]MBP2250470.1 hypothetical protein [Halarchaeum solikamskense]
MSSKCRLCGDDRELRQSHIIPNFVIRWLKESGATPFLRGVDDPDTRIQDKKEKLLCSECEQRIGDWEQQFASRIFYPVIRQQKTDFEYDSWLKRFTISLSWRFLVSSFSAMDAWDSDEQTALREAEHHWRAILNGDQPLSAATRSHHLILLGETESVPSEAPEGWEFYSSRGIDASVVTVDDGIYIYSKFPQMFLLSCVDPPSVDGLGEARIEQTGTIETPQVVHSPWSKIPFRRAEIITENKASPREQEKIKQHIQEHPDSLVDSKTIETFRRKLDRQGHSEHDPTAYLNDDECPICSTNHRVVDALPARPLSRSAINELKDADRVAFAKGVFISLDDSAEQDVEDTGTVVLSTSDTTQVVSLLDPGWVVDREINHVGQTDPSEFGSAIWELVSDEYSAWMEEYASDRDFTIN